MAQLRLRSLILAVALVVGLAELPWQRAAQAAVELLPPIDLYGDGGTAVSSTNTYRSIAVSAQKLRSVGFDLYWGTATGTFTVQVSNKKRPVASTDADWKDLVLARPITQPTGTSGGDYVDLEGIPFLWVRLKYVNASGSSTINAFAVGKQ